jgi:glyoxylase-like metal-dependent hydrolase (beta-lactamase superfamily II)
MKKHRRSVMKVQEFFDPATYTLTYVVYDPEASRDAVVIDPVLDYEPGPSQDRDGLGRRASSRFIATDGLKLHYVLETHAHADHLSGSQLLKSATARRSPSAPASPRCRALFRGPLRPGREFPADGRSSTSCSKTARPPPRARSAVRVLATPGHTPACLSYVIGDAVFTGDALFMPDYGTGRCDFPGGSADDALPLHPAALRAARRHPGVRRPRLPARRPRAALRDHHRRLQGANVQLRAEHLTGGVREVPQARDATLAAPRLLFPSVQVNIDAGRLPRPRANGKRYLNVPINLFHPTDDIGNPAK